MSYLVYILECSDGSYYTGSTNDIKKRLWQHEQGMEESSYTFSRRPVKLVWTSHEVEHYYEALRWERQIKGWSRAKKAALIRGEFETIHEIVKTERKQREQNKKTPPPLAEPPFVGGVVEVCATAKTKVGLKIILRLRSTSARSAQDGNDL